MGFLVITAGVNEFLQVSVFIKEKIAIRNLDMPADSHSRD